MRLRSIVSILGIALTLSGCSSSKTLSRAKAKELIENSKKLGDQCSIRLTEETRVEGAKEGYWTSSGDNPFLTEKGSKTLTGIYRNFGDDGPFFLVLPKTVTRRRALDVVGIEGDEGSSSHRVQFTWKCDLSPYPDDIKELFKNQAPQKGYMILTRFDDGWRVDDGF
jgi:hypothetical protein